MSRQSADQARFDVRITERSIARGRLSHKEYKEHLKALPDLAAKAVASETELPESATPPKS